VGSKVVEPVHKSGWQVGAAGAGGRLILLCKLEGKQAKQHSPGMMPSMRSWPGRRSASEPPAAGQAGAGSGEGAAMSRKSKDKRMVLLLHMAVTALCCCRAVPALPAYTACTAASTLTACTARTTAAATQQPPPHMSSP
jgi:hypothetical protein